MAFGSGVGGGSAGSSQRVRTIHTLLNGGTDNLAALATTDKSSLVAALNEVLAAIGAPAALINDTAPAATATTFSAAKISDLISTAINDLINEAPGTLDTLAELAAALAADTTATAAILESLAGKAAIDHEHVIADVTDLQASLDTKAPVIHGHEMTDVNGLAAALEGKAAAIHIHDIDDIDELRTELDARADKALTELALAGKAAIDHGHSISDVEDLVSTLAGKAPVFHSHVIADTTGLTEALADKSEIGHIHDIADTIGLTEALAGKASSVHGHSIAQITNLQTTLDGKAAVGHIHEIADTTGLQAALDGKADDVHAHEIADTTGLQGELDGKAAVIHGHTAEDIVGLDFAVAEAVEQGVGDALDAKADLVHAHTIADVTDLQAALDDKAATDHDHTIADITNLQTTLDAKAEASTVASKIIGINFVIDGGGIPVQPGEKGDLIIPFAGTVLGWTLIADEADTAVVDIWKAGFASYPPVIANSMTGSDKPTLDAELSSASTVLTGWDTAIVAGDILRIAVNSTTGVAKRFTLMLTVEKA